LNKLEKYFFSSKPLDFLSVKIIKQLYKYGPRNISFISRQLGYPKRTIYLKYTTLINKLNLKIKAMFKYNMLGLVHTFLLFTPKKMKYYKDIIKRIEKNPYFLELWQYHSNVFSILSLALVPIEAISFLYDLVDSYMLQEPVRVYTTTSPFPILPNFNFYNFENFYWYYDPSSVIKESDNIYLPEDPKSFKILIDEIDLEIIKKIQNDASVKISSIAKELNLSRPRIKYHFDNHIHPILLDRYAVDFQRFNEPTIDVLVYLLFKNKRETMKAASFFLNNPFIHYLYKEIKKYGIFLRLEVPRRDFEKILFSYLNRIQEESDVRKYFYLILGRRIYRKNIPSKLFSNKKWNVDIFRQTEEKI